MKSSDAGLSLARPRPQRKAYWWAWNVFAFRLSPITARRKTMRARADRASLLHEFGSAAVYSQANKRSRKILKDLSQKNEDRRQRLSNLK
jgi:hypothetical protein